MYFQHSLPACCSVGFLHSFTGDFLYGANYAGNAYAQKIIKAPVPPCKTTSGAFIAIFTQGQKKDFEKVCAKHDLLSVTWTKGGHTNVRYLAICVFRSGKNKAADDRYGAVVADGAKQNHWSES